MNDETHDPQQSNAGQTGSPGSAGGVPVAVVAGLAREVDALRRAVRANADLPGRLAELANTVADLADELSGVGGSVADAVAIGSWLDRHGIPDPTAQADAGQDYGGADDDGGDESSTPALVPAGELLDDLVAWVGRVFLRYSDAATAFPECWLWHPEIVEELLWLHGAWKAAYQGSGAVSGSVGAVGDWHDRYRPGVMRRIGKYAGHCSLSKHTGGDTPADLGRAPYSDAAEAVAEWWSDGRLDGTGPTPTLDQLARSAARYRRDPTTRLTPLR